MDDEERTTALGFYHYAHSYAASAIALSKASVDATHPRAPMTELFRHAIELYLKAYLKHKGVTVLELRKHYGHSIKRLSKKALLLGLQISAGERALMLGLEDPSHDRYLRTGTRRILTEAPRLRSALG